MLQVPTTVDGRTARLKVAAGESGPGGPFHIIGGGIMEIIEG